MNDKPIEITNTNQAVPKKSKIVQSKNHAPPETGGTSSEVKPRRAPRVRRGATGRKTPTTESATVSMPPEAGTPTEPSDDAIRVRAYFISERRRRFALPGDAESDWLEAKRQLLSEVGCR
jgi:hypothetical protein